MPTENYVILVSSFIDKYRPFLVVPCSFLITEYGLYIVNKETEWGLNILAIATILPKDPGNSHNTTKRPFIYFLLLLR
jgi:hypothetical protein